MNKETFSVGKILSLACLALLFFSASLAVAGDGGEERVIPVIRWSCWLCNWEVFTFAPDNIEGKKDPKHKDVNFQQQNWMLFHNPSSAIRKCSKAPDGAHYFDEKQKLTTSPEVIYQLRESYVVLKNGGSMQAKLMNWTCIGCNLKGVSFHGDDLDLVGKFAFGDSQNVFNMKSGSKIHPCTIKLGNEVCRYHLMHITSNGTAKSYNLAQALQNVWYSD